MSSKTSKKVAIVPKALEPIITRTKSAQQRRQLRNKNIDKKTVNPIFTKPEIKSPKLKKTLIRSKEALPKEPEKSCIEVLEQVEYYPNKLKRDVCTKKIMLKPKHNFKVIAATNKRKLATPQKGIKSSPLNQNSSRNFSKSPKRSRIAVRPCSSPEISMQDMVRIMEETRSLSDEDFMEILTCPSPVWWEDPPDGGYDEDSIYTRSPEPPEKTTKETKKRKNTANTPTSKSNKITNVEHNPEQLKLENIQDEKFVKKKQKLENILGIIKNKTIKPKNEVKNNERNRKLSESEGDISDLSFNEEEILKNLENMDIPVEQPVIEPVDIKKEIDEIEIKKEKIENYENELTSKNEKVVRNNLSPILVKSEIKEEFSIKSTVSDIDRVPKTNSQFKNNGLEETSTDSDKKSEEILFNDSCTNSSLGKNEDSQSLLDGDYICNSGTRSNSPKNALNSNVVNILNTDNDNDVLPNKKTNDLSEYITVYKIIPEEDSENNPEIESQPAVTTKKPKLDTVRGKLNDFFKQCKRNKRLKKTESPIPAIPVTDVKEETTDNEIQNGDNKINLEDKKNRLKTCDYCIEKTENGKTDFSCEKCEKAPILPCDLCNFLADTKEIYRKHVSSCKDVARISWNHNYVLNQT